MVEAYIGLGSNLQSPKQQIKRARDLIAKHQHMIEQSFSGLYSSPPMGPQDQPDYINAVMRVDTELSALDMLKALQQIENTQGRVRKGDRWGARTLDLDLLLYANQQIDHPDLIVPHSGLSDRAFVLYPLQEIAPENLMIPGQGLLKQLISHCPMNGLEKVA